ncbi:MAG: hypothetical protein QG594_156, partial [Bacteroidota bacterium]|nr:hypothetical protein [Bacteroidota bacterium]
AEAYPITPLELASMNYVHELEADAFQSVFDRMHAADWGIENKLDDCFSLTKKKMFFQEIDDLEAFDLIYFDAFGYRVQPELWSTDIFRKMFNALKNNGVLVTYAARGVVKRSMITVGFTVEKLAGPPGKREMFRAKKQVF